MSENYDLIVIGAGGVGLASGMYAARLGLKTLVLGTSHGSELPVGGVITTTNLVENYPGFEKISGFGIAKKIEEHARSYDLVTIKEEKVIDVSKGFEVKTDKGVYGSKALIFATGTKRRKLDVPGSAEFDRKGVHYCALCDAPFYKDKVVAVVGGSDSAVKDALVLAQHAKKVYVIYRGDEIRAELFNLKKAEESGNIEFIKNTNVVEIKGDEFVNGVVLDKEYEGGKDLKLEGVFVDIGSVILSDLAKKIGVDLNERDEIKIDHATSKTSVEGVFAAGDVTDKPFKQLITGVGDGCTASYFAYEYVIGKK